MSLNSRIYRKCGPLRKPVVLIMQQFCSFIAYKGWIVAGRWSHQATLVNQWIISIIRLDPIPFYQMIIIIWELFQCFLFVVFQCPRHLSRVPFPLILTDRALCRRALWGRLPPRFSVMSQLLSCWTLLPSPPRWRLMQTDQVWRYLCSLHLPLKLTASSVQFDPDRSQRIFLLWIWQLKVNC